MKLSDVVSLLGSIAESGQSTPARRELTSAIWAKVRKGELTSAIWAKVGKGELTSAI